MRSTAKRVTSVTERKEERTGEGDRREGKPRFSALLAFLSLRLPLPPYGETPSVSVGLYPQPPAACLEQQQRETVGWQRSWQGGKGPEGETVGERKEGGGRETRWRGDAGYSLGFMRFMFMFISCISFNSVCVLHRALTSGQTHTTLG